MAAGLRAGVAIRSAKLGLQHDMSASFELVAIDTSQVPHAMSLLLQNDLSAFENCLSKHLAQHGAAVFSQELAIPMIEAVGEMWQQGRLPVYAVHIFSSIMQKVALRPVLHPETTKFSTPRVLLASPAAEAHTLALVLMNVQLYEADIPSVFLQGGLPACEIAAAAAAFKVEVVALSASVTCPARLLTSELRTLRGLLDVRTELWVGGAGTHRISSRMNEVTVMTSIDEAVQTLKIKFGSDPNIIGTVKDKNHG